MSQKKYAVKRVPEGRGKTRKLRQINRTCAIPFMGNFAENFTKPARRGEEKIEGLLRERKGRKEFTSYVTFVTTQYFSSRNREGGTRGQGTRSRAKGGGDEETRKKKRWWTSDDFLGQGRQLNPRQTKRGQREKACIEKYPP